MMRSHPVAVLGLALCSPAALLGPAHSQSIDGAAVSDPIRLAQAQPPPLRWHFEKILPTGSDLKRRRDSPALLTFMFRMVPRDGWVITWDQWVHASGQRLAQEFVTRGSDTFASFRIDPCKAAGLDTPGTEIPITYEFVFSATRSVSAAEPARAWIPPAAKGSFTLKLDRDTKAPVISSVTAPRVVARDQTVEVAVSASDASEEMAGEPVWDSGLRVFRLEGPSNPRSWGMQTHTFGDRAPTTCAEKVNKASHAFSYTVPHSAQPGDVITLNVEVEDWAGNKSAKTVELKVPERRDANTPPQPSQDGSGGGGGARREPCVERKIVRGMDFTWFCP